MRAQLRGMYSPDAPEIALADYRPENGESFALLIGAFIGPDTPPLGEELFSFTVCTAKWLAANPPPKGFEFLRGTIVMTRWDYSVLERAINDLCLHTEGADWPEIGRKLNRFGRWEFDG